MKIDKETVDVLSLLIEAADQIEQTVIGCLALGADPKDIHIKARLDEPERDVELTFDGDGWTFDISEPSPNPAAQPDEEDEEEDASSAPAAPARRRKGPRK